MRLLKSLCLTFSIFSKIPVPRVYRSKENMKYTVCFLPLVGIIIGAVLMGWFYVCLNLGIKNACFAGLATAIPMILTGRVHASGFLSVSDALSTYGPKQKKLEVLADPHAGTLGVVSVIIYYILYFGFMNEVTIYGATAMIALGFIMSRALCGAELVLMKPAKKVGLAYELSTSMNRTLTLCVMIIMLLACALLMIFLSPFVGGLVLAGLILLVMYYKFFTAKKTGGITGDTCGYFIQLAEIIVLILVVIGSKVAELLLYLS